MLTGVRVESNNNIGISVNMTGSTSPQGVTVVLNDGQVNNNTQGISVVQPAATQNVGMTIIHSNVSGNAGFGINAAGGGVVLRVSDTEITGNSPGLSISGGATISSYGDNMLDGNPTVGPPNNGAFTGVPIPKK